VHLTAPLEKELQRKLDETGIASTAYEAERPGSSIPRIRSACIRKKQIIGTVEGINRDFHFDFPADR
jgi:hypothetical protein